MADLVRALEADLFGAHAWAADLYQELLEAPQPADRLAAAQGLLRALESLEKGETVDAANRAEVPAEQLAQLGMDAASVLAEAEDALEPEAREAVESLAAPRDALLAAPRVAEAEAFAQAFDDAWERGPREALVADALLACLARSNVVASGLRATLGEEGAKALHAQAARTYEEVARLLGERLTRGERVWADTTAGALNRAARAWTLAGRNEDARRAALEATRLANEARG